MNLLQLRDRVYAHLRDEDHEFFLTEEVEGWLNDAQIDLATRLRTIRRKVSAVIEEVDGRIALPDDFLEAITLRFGTADTEFVDDDIFHSWVDAGIEAGHPLAIIFGGYIETWPVMEEDTDYELRYIALPTEMDSDDDEPEVGKAHHIRMTYYALDKAWMKKDEPRMAESWLSRYEDGLPGLPSGQAEYNAGPITLQPEPGPFDTYPGARHI